MDNLGPLVKLYELDNRRRGRVALVLLILGLLVTPLSVLAAIPAYGNSIVGDDFVPSVAAGCGVGMLVMGCWLAVQYFTRSDEAFELHEGGLAHVHGTKRRAVRWEDVASVIDIGRNNLVARIFARILGGPTSVQVKAAQGRSLVIPSLVKDGEALVTVVRQAVDEGLRPRPGSSG